jgi:hypothetical protein
VRFGAFRGGLQAQVVHKAGTLRRATRPANRAGVGSAVSVKPRRPVNMAGHAIGRLVLGLLAPTGSFGVSSGLAVFRRP